MRGVSVYSLLFSLAIFIRIVFLFNPGFEADISFWKSWGLATYDKGIVEGLKVTNNNYPTPFAYTLGTMVAVYSIFADPHNFNEFWSNTNLLFLVISKMYPVLADIGIALLFLYIGKHAIRLGFPVFRFPESGGSDSGNQRTFAVFGMTFYELLSIFYLLSPLSLIDGAWWGQVDSMGVFLFLGSLLFALSRRPFLAGLVFILAMMTKLQNMIYGPVFFLFIWQTMRYPGLIRAIFGAVLGFVGLNIEFVGAGYMDRVFASLTENYDYFPWMSLMAFNLWWIVSGGAGMQMSDKVTVLGILNAKTVGLVIFSSLYLVAVLRQLLLSKKVATLLESLIIVNGAFFLFQSQSHDRYAFPLSVFLLLWAPFAVHSTNSHIQRNRIRIFFLLYVLFTVFYFYNLHYALAINYPHNAIPILSLMTHPVLTIGTSVILIGLFLLYLLYLSFTSRISRYIMLSVCAIAIGGLLYLNKPLFTRQPVLLTHFVPYISVQGYGGRQTDRSVQSSFGGPQGWNRLSVQYVFYRHGIGTHAVSRHVYNVAGKFRTFTTDYGIDTESGDKATAVFEIYGDDTLLFRSETMGRYDMPRHASVDITGVENLSLVTTDAGDGNYDDHTDWLNPTLWP